MNETKNVLILMLCVLFILILEFGMGNYSTFSKLMIDTFHYIFLLTILPQFQLNLILIRIVLLQGEICMVLFIFYF